MEQLGLDFIKLNKDCIAINQDPAEQGRRVKSNGNVEIWIKQLKGGDKAVLVLNRNKEAQKKLLVDLNEFGISGKSKILEVYSRKMLKNSNGTLTFDMAPNSCQFLLVR